MSRGGSTRFQAGHVPWNVGKKGWFAAGTERTRFKKGLIPPKRVQTGTEVERSDGLMWIKTDVGMKPKHTFLYEAENGEIPAGHVVIFGDGNKRNFELSNLILVSRSQLVLLNRNHLIMNDADLTRASVAITDIVMAANEKRKGSKDKKNSARHI